MFFDGSHKIRDPISAHGRRQKNPGVPFMLVTSGFQHLLYLNPHSIRPITVGFVDHEDIRNFHDAGLEHLHAVA